jgi:hypothetical protein
MVGRGDIAPVIPATQGSTNRIEVQAFLSIKQDKILKITNTKMAGRVAQVVVPI